MSYRTASAPGPAPLKWKQNTIQGVGLGLRSCHYSHILKHLPSIAWFEVLADNYMGDGGQPLDYLSQIREHYPITFHSVGLSLGGSDPLSVPYLNKLKALKERFEPAWLSDHICWARAANVHGHELFPMPYTLEAVNHLTERIDQVQSILGQAILIENVSSYLSFECDEMSEVEFVSSVLSRSGCYLLCDVNNIFVSSINHGFDPYAYLDALPIESVKEIHLAGFEDCGDYLLDTHGKAVSEAVWHLYEYALRRFGQVPSLIEWDTDIPDFTTLNNEANKAREYMRRVNQ